VLFPPMPPRPPVTPFAHPFGCARGVAVVGTFNRQVRSATPAHREHSQPLLPNSLWRGSCKQETTMITAQGLSRRPRGYFASAVPSSSMESMTLLRGSGPWVFRGRFGRWRTHQALRRRCECGRGTPGVGTLPNDQRDFVRGGAWGRARRQAASVSRVRSTRIEHLCYTGSMPVCPPDAYLAESDPGRAWLNGAKERCRRSHRKSVRASPSTRRWVRWF